MSYYLNVKDLHSREELMDIREDLKRLSIEETCKKYKITFQDLCKICSSSIKKGNHKQNNSFPKYINPVSARFEVMKCLDGKSVVFGHYMSLEEAIEVRDKLISLGWKANPLDYLGDKYITKTNQKYSITKTFGRNNTIHYGRYNSLEDARKVRDKLVKCNWEKSQLQQICRELGVEKVGDNK